MNKSVLSIPVLLPLLVVVLGPAWLAAQPADPALRQEHEEIARRQAVEQLRQQVRAADLEGVEVASFVDDYESFAGHADIGGPRWTDAGTCQVQARLTGEALTDAEHDETADLVALADLQFIAVGTALPQENLGSVAPVGVSVWEQVPGADREAALRDATADAVSGVVESVKPLPEPLAEALQQYLAARPVASVRFAADADRPTAEVALAVTADEVAAFLEGAASQRDDISLDALAPMLEGLRDTSLEALGRATLAPRAEIDVQFDDQPPTWLNDPLTVTIRTGPENGRLRAARQAEDEAARAIIDALLEKPFAGSTVAAAAERDPRVAAAIDAAVARLQIVKVRYLADGGARVEARLEPRHFWNALP